MNQQFAFRKKLIATLVLSALGITLFPASAFASEAEVMKKIEALQAEITALKSQVAAKPATVPAASTEGKSVSAQSGKFEFYGVLDVGLESNDDGRVKRTVMQSYSSNIGFRGERALTDNLRGLLQIETKIAPDSSDNSKPFASRNSYVGLGSNFGSVIWGTYDTPLKAMKTNVKMLEGNADTMEHIIHGKANGAIGANFHTRPMNTLQYWSPDLSGFKVKLAYSPDENKGAAPDKTLRKDVSSSLEYNSGWWNVGVATDKKSDYATAGKDISAVKAIGGIKFDKATLGLAFSRVDNDAGKKANNWMASGQYVMGPFVLKANYGVAGESSGGAQDGGKMVGLEADYVWDKATMIYVYYANYSADSKAVGFKYDAGENGYKTTVAGDDAKVLGLAVQYKF